MKKITLLLITFIFANMHLTAQDVKPCLFIGIYDSEKKGICSNKTWIHEGVNDRVGYDQRRLEFKEAHKLDESFSTSTVFVSNKQCVIVFEYKKKISGFTCNPIAINFITGVSVENCKEQLAVMIAKSPAHYVTQPKIIFTWEGKGETQKQTLTEDYGGLIGKFHLVDKSGGGSLVVAQLSNKTTDKLATVILRTDNGQMTVEYLNPGEVLTKKYDTKTLEVQVVYQDSKKPKPEFSVIQFVKDQVRKQVTNENGTLKSTSPVGGIRG